MGMAIIMIHPYAKLTIIFQSSACRLIFISENCYKPDFVVTILQQNIFTFIWLYFRLLHNPIPISRFD